MRLWLVALAALLLSVSSSFSQNVSPLVVSACGALPAQYVAGRPGPLTVSPSGRLCSGSTPSVAPLPVNGIATLTGMAVSACGAQTLAVGRPGVITVDLNGNAC